MLSIGFVTVPVADQQRARRWYTEKLQCQVVRDDPYGPGTRWLELSFPGGPSHIVLFTPPEFEGRVGTFLGITFTADDIDAVYHDMTVRGVEFIRPLETVDWGGKQAVFCDSEGNQFVLAHA